VFREGACSFRGCSGGLTLGAVLVSGRMFKATRRPTREGYIRLFIELARKWTQPRYGIGRITIRVLGRAVW
jgi:hypothetical protein